MDMAHTPSFEDAKHCFRGVREGLERVPGQPEGGVLECDQGTAGDVPGRVAEYQKTSRVVGCSTEEPFIVGVAAHHSVQNHDVGRLNHVRRGRDVQHPTVDAVSDACLVSQRAGQ